MVKVEWNKFKAKFSDNPQKNFEWFCYLLFCKEFNKPIGITRYINQSGIETLPIVKEDEVIGWQAKFYETSLSAHKEDLIATINKSKRDYPNITKIIFFTNSEWGQGKKQNDPKAKSEIENTATTLNVKIEWRTASFFESPFVVEENELIADYFFNLNKNVFDYLKQKLLQNESILYDIQSSIIFQGTKIEIDRSNLVQMLKEEIEQSQVVIISGVGGVGKTAIIKKLYEEQKDSIPFYIFKGSEFDVSNINILFKDTTLQEFLQVCADDENKVLIIDSAEKLLDLKYTDPFKQFLSSFIRNNWKIVFTTRDTYLEDLNYQFIEIHQIIPRNYDIQNLTYDELLDLAAVYNFELPVDDKIVELIKNPFYLNEYLRFYQKDENIDYLSFKEKLWNKVIKKSRPAREQCFMQTALQRANQGQFFVTPNFEHQILDELHYDGILGYQSAGYFITHDIYEEWALEKIIETEFIKRESDYDLFHKIGESLSIRRSFRKWLSEKLLLEDESIKQFIEEVLQEETIESFWKDEILVSVLLSPYADTFFDIFKNQLLEDNQSLLKKLTFLLRIACKEVDNELLKKLEPKERSQLSYKYVFTRPKGKGWESLIKFTYMNLEAIGFQNINFILPIIYDWNLSFKYGETSRFSSLIALKYYQWIIKEDIYFSRDEDIKEKLFYTIMYGATEIKDKLNDVFEQVLQNNWKEHRDPYNEFIITLLTTYGNNIEVIKVLPEKVLCLADLYWSENRSKRERWYHSSAIGVEEDFGIKANHQGYYPASAFQTPIYFLLRHSLQKTVDFILAFTNRTVECYANSELDKNEVSEIDVYIDNGITHKQYISNRVWNIYRGTQVAPDILESIHMALEKFLLEGAEYAKPESLENWLLYLLTNTKSASISAIVVSVTLAYPEKTFNIAKVLYRTKEFFLYDTKRMSLEHTAKINFGIGYGLNYQHKIYQDERLQSCDAEHRKRTLEFQMLNYQVFRREETSELEAEERQKEIWNILDEYYKELADKSENTEDEKTWRLYLARMDRRKMSIETDVQDGQVLLSFNPELTPELKEYSEESMKKSSESMKYTMLKLWANYKMKNDIKYKSYEQFENNPTLVINQVKEILDGFKETPDYNYYLFNHSIPSEVCAVLIRDYFTLLSVEDRDFCKNIVIDYASFSLKDDYSYQMSDGVESSIYVLSTLMVAYPDEREIIKFILLLTLFDEHDIGMYCAFADYAINAILDLWNKSHDDAESLLVAFLLLKPNYDRLKTEMRKKQKNYQLSKNKVIMKFTKDNKGIISKIFNNKINISQVKDIDSLELKDLLTAFELLPSNVNYEEYKNLIQAIINKFAANIFPSGREEKLDYTVRHKFMSKLADFILKLPEDAILDYLNPIINELNSSEGVAELLKEFISSQDKLIEYEKFWKVWNLIYDKIIGLCKNGKKYWYTDNIIQSYLFAQTIWKENVTDWHTLKEVNKTFFKKITEDIGYCPSVLYSIAKLLNNIGSNYLDDGIIWISKIIDANKNLWADELEKGTIYYMETATKKFVFLNREKIKRTRLLRQETIIILNFLIEKGSVIGYMLRENIL
nr:AVAST type 4 anti-phage nuclease Avs4 [uncultured Anaerocolumna sp.]